MTVLICLHWPFLYPRTQQLAMRMTSYGRIKEFRLEEETIESYLERIKLFFTAQEIADAKKVSVFVSLAARHTQFSEA